MRVPAIRPVKIAYQDTMAIWYIWKGLSNKKRLFCFPCRPIRNKFRHKRKPTVDCFTLFTPSTGLVVYNLNFFGGVVCLASIAASHQSESCRDDRRSAQVRDELAPIIKNIWTCWSPQFIASPLPANNSFNYKWWKSPQLWQFLSFEEILLQLNIQPFPDMRLLH